MTQISSLRPSRRSLLAGGALVVSSFTLPETVGRAMAQGAGRPPLLPTELDSFLAIGVDGTVNWLSLALQAMEASGANVEDISLRQPSLDEVFLTLTGGKQ